jgi:predicted Fe-S protein YdhL (DUF1289 family)
MMEPVERLAERARAVAQGSSAEVPSPCISVCRMDAAGEYCEGCCRSLDEIAAWSGLSAPGKREVWRRIGERALTPALPQGEREQEKP